MPEIGNGTLPAVPEQKTVLFGKYELGKLLGQGGFAKVYHGRDVHTGKSVAVKVVSKQKILKGNLTAHVKREVSIMRRLHHPHIIRLHEVLATKSKVYFIMEFAKGGELFAKVSKGRFSEDLSRRYFQQLISAVGYCHSRGVYHRDLKPENLLLDENWNLKISDFGLSAVKDETSGSDGMLHTMCGTPAYVAPEILAKKGYDGAKVDIWSCGIILFVLTSGYLPFNDANLMNLYRKIYKGDFRCPKHMSPELKDLLAHLLDTNPKTRYSIQDILDHPWFKKGEKEVDLPAFYFGDDVVEVEEKGKERYMNAFDLISFSPGFNLSGLLEEEVKGETFLSKEAAERVVERVEEAARATQGVEVERMRSGMGVRVEGQNGEFGVVVEVHRLTEDLVVVEVRNRVGVEGSSHQFWKDTLRPTIDSLVYNPGRAGPGGSAPGVPRVA